jgi:hypothetical protein
MAPIIEPADRPERREQAGEEIADPAQPAQDARAQPPIDYLMLFDD